MDLNYQQHIPADFPAASRVWIYQSSRLFSIPEALELEKNIESFLTDWQTHGTANKGYANLFFGQFLVIMADETHQKISGCSTDSSVRFIKGVEQLFSVQMFDRQSLAFISKDKVQLLPLAQLSYAIENKFIDRDTLYFNNLVSTKEEWLNNWIIPVKNSWLAARLPQQAL
ncbi:MAG TPA: hypothetical protein VFQ86_12745 [Arachidicoccus soli]|uniref:ABC transporter ATPase n=1 Tax=Arachidicoccus soli TaxID=2341117 RepID=A0A386HQ89_9BACT|nr:hypothetical protein [Arachidicoccus soli]AYD47862.1 hypothetical protein D6B99_09830 [Arachidicoccus soli]HEU0228601.1 hypothetical protein [Arachidicoccus soli]